MTFFTPDDAVLATLVGAVIAILALARATRAQRASEAIEDVKVDLLKRIVGLQEARVPGGDPNAARVAALASRLLTQLAELPDPPKDRAIRAAGVWTETDMEILETSAAALGLDQAREAADAVPALTKIRDLVHRVQATNVSYGFDYNREFPKDDWSAWLLTARRALTVLSGTREAEDSALDVTMDRDHVYIDNVGETIARDVQLEFEPDPERECDGPLVQGDYDRLLPAPELRPGETVTLIAALAFGCYPPFDVVLTWRDDLCGPNERRSRAKRLTI